MKKLHLSTKIIFAALLYALCIKTNAQEGKIYQPTNIERYFSDNQGDEKNIYSFEYNDEGLLTKFTDLKTENSHLSYSIDLKYNGYNLPVEKTITYLNPDPYNNIKYNFYYDINNSNRIDSIFGYGMTENGDVYLISSLRNYYEGDKIILQKENSHICTIEYPTDNTAVAVKNNYKRIQSNISDATFFTFYEWQAYDYYINGGVNYIYNDGKLDKIHKYEYQYLIGDLELAERQKFTYNGNNLISIRGDVNMYDTIPYNDNRVDYIYDSLNRLQSIICTDNNYNNQIGDNKNPPCIDDVFLDPNLKFIDEILTSHIFKEHVIEATPTTNYFGAFDSLFVTSYIETPIPHYGIVDILEGAEWYYEITDDDGNVTYQYLQSSGDTVVGGERPHIVVRTNTLYDKSTHVTHEYVYFENNTIYWWNKKLEKFTILYDFNAVAGDSWVIETENGNVTMNVDSVEDYVYNGKTYKMLIVSDENDIFSGNIVCGIGHLTSFFPEKLMIKDKDFGVNGIRCYWQHNSLIFKYGDGNCDETYEIIHFSISENNENSISVCPNPSKNELIISQNDPRNGNSIIRIFDVNGRQIYEKLLSGKNEIVNTNNWKSGIYLIQVGNENVKWLKY